MRKFWRENRTQLLILILLPVIVFPWAATGLSRFAGVDIVKLHQPMRWFDVQSVRNGDFPFWNPNIFSGFPQFAEGESGFLYLGNFPQYLPIDFSYAYTWVILLHFALAALIAYSCLRHFGLDKRIACCFSIVWAYSPFFMFHVSAPTIPIVLAWYPAFIQLADSLPGRPLRRLGWLAILASQMLFAGSVQMASFAFTAYFVYAGVRWASSRRDVPNAGTWLIWAPFIGLVTGATIAIVQIGSTSALLPFTIRGGEMSESFRSTGSWLDLSRLGSIFTFPLFAHTDELLHYGSSLLYIGLIPGIFLIGSILYGWRKKSLRVHLITAAILIAFAMGTRNPFNFWMAHVSPFDMYRYYGRFAGFASWHLLIASGMWLAAWLEAHPAVELDRRRAARFIGRPLLIVLILLAVYAIFNRVSPLLLLGALYLLIQEIAICVLLRRAPWRIHLATAAAVFAILLAYPLGNILQLDTREYKRVMGVFEQLAEERPGGRFFMEGEGPLVSLDGHGPFFLTPYRTMKGFAGGNAASMSGLNVLSGYSPLKFRTLYQVIREIGDRPLIDGFERNELYKRIFPDYIVTREDIQIDGFERVEGIDLTGIAEDGYLLRSIVPAPDSLLIPANAISDDLAGISVDRPEKTYSRGSSDERRYWRNAYTIQVDAEEDSSLVVLDSIWVGWQAFIDGEETPILVYKHKPFITVEIPAGSHTVEFRYHFTLPTLGLAISLACLIIALALIIFPLRRFEAQLK